jgi:K+/H+ antiporter YhaU regulatory subunit KhtT
VIAVASFFLVVLVALLIARVATVALMATGMPREIARFQSRSALSGVGFTTGEAESVVGHPVRRRIVFVLMLVGNAGFVTIVASLALTFASSGNTGDVLERLGVIIGGLIAILFVARTRRFERIVTRGIARLLGRWTDLEVRDMIHVMQLTKDYAVTELRVAPGDWLAGKSLIDLQLPDEGVIVLAIQRANGAFLGAPRGSAIVHPYDTLILYGRSSVLADLDRRPNDPEGDVAHIEAVAEHRDIADSEDGDEEA